LEKIEDVTEIFGKDEGCYRIFWKRRRMLQKFLEKIKDVTEIFGKDEILHRRFWKR
jgi:hypothetical protein